MTLCREYNLIGVLMGLAVYNSIILDLHFPSICYRKLLTPPVVPQEVHTTHASDNLVSFFVHVMCHVKPYQKVAFVKLTNLSPALPSLVDILFSKNPVCQLCLQTSVAIFQKRECTDN